MDRHDIQLTIHQISDILLMNGGFLNNPGLYTGEMGLVLFFARYARYTQNDLYLEYAYDLMGKIQDRIHLETPINYKQGLTGIGSAIEYLVQNDFFEADTDEILEDFDKRIFFTYNFSYLSIDKIIDIGYYAAWRLSGNSAQKEMIRKTILPKIENCSDIAALHQKTVPDNLKVKTSKNDFWSKDMGLKNGLSGWGLSLLTELDGDNSWFSLLPNDLK